MMNMYSKLYVHPDGTAPYQVWRQSLRAILRWTICSSQLDRTFGSFFTMQHLAQGYRGFRVLLLFRMQGEGFRDLGLYQLSGQVMLKYVQELQFK